MPVRVLWAVMALLVNTVLAPAQDSAPTEYQLKAAFLYNFAKFVDWPSNSFANDHSPFAICILGVDPFGSTIDDTLRGKTIGDHPVVVQRGKEPADVRHCHIIFISSSEKRRLPEILAALQGVNALIVGETERFADSGGTIQLMIEQNHVRFAINTDAAESSGLRISSKLLALAKVVHTASDSGKE
jgi:YfiR/HmsC-like